MEFLDLSQNLNSFEEIFFAIIGVLIFVLLLFWFIDALSKAVIIKKAGRSLGIGFVPVYNDYVLCEITGTNKFWFALKYCIPFFVNLIEAALPVENNALGLLSLFATFGYTIAFSASLSKSFGRGTLTMVCHILFPQITRFVVAANNKYIGAKGCNDVIFRGNGVSQKTSNNFNTNINNPVINNHPEYHFCPNCGNAITEYDRFCNKCGREI